MDKDEILKRSQNENKGQFDECEISALGKASRIGMLVGALLCVALVIVSRYVFNIPELALTGWMIYFAMQGSSDIVLYKYLKQRPKLIYGILYIALSIAFTVALIFKTMV